MWPNALLQHPAAAAVKHDKDGSYHSSLTIDATMEPNSSVPAFRGLRVRCAINVQHPNDSVVDSTSGGGGREYSIAQVPEVRPGECNLDS